jgi:hypothetical protein
MKWAGLLNEQYLLSFLGFNLIYFKICKFFVLFINFALT